MKVEQLKIPKEQAIDEYEAYKQTLKKPQFEHQQYLKDLKAIYGHMRHGRAIIDLWAAMKKAGLKKNGNPRLAICRADSKKVRFVKRNGESSCFWFEKPKWRYDYQRWEKDVEIPEGTFDHWEEITETHGSGMQTWEVKDIPNKEIETIVPIIPAKFLMALRGSLKNYHILWEVKKWKPVPPIDPILCRKLTPNMFVVLASWDLTPLERAVIKGRIQ